MSRLHPAAWAVVAAHEAPDTVGIRGPGLFAGGRWPLYVDYVQLKVAESIARAAEREAPVTCVCLPLRLSVYGKVDPAAYPVLEDPNAGVPPDPARPDALHSRHYHETTSVSSWLGPAVACTAVELWGGDLTGNPSRAEWLGSRSALLLLPNPFAHLHLVGTIPGSNTGEAGGPHGDTGTAALILKRVPNISQDAPGYGTIASNGEPLWAGLRKGAKHLTRRT